ncbi:hypothetical protein CRM22_010740 [Opisthorchis felineus]|uniref:BED-type domain-containing protein n=1 Tax=Opisthorchis felineus TaxID=147828 RepID=A0A4S2KP09_OPIFE|nr:hypothetical protein CRM22_010740 [Opisthorchis felineus]
MIMMDHHSESSEHNGKMEDGGEMNASIRMSAHSLPPVGNNQHATYEQFNFNSMSHQDQHTERSQSTMSIGRYPSVYPHQSFRALPVRHPTRWGLKSGAKKSFVWKYFFHPEISLGVRDLSHTQCTLCDSQLAFNTSGTTTTMLNHLKSRHMEVVENEQQHHQKQRPPHHQRRDEEQNQRPHKYLSQSSGYSSAVGSVETPRNNWIATDNLVDGSYSLKTCGYMRAPFLRRAHRGRPPNSWTKTSCAKKGSLESYSAKLSYTEQASRDGLLQKTSETDVSEIHQFRQTTELNSKGTGEQPNSDHIQPADEPPWPTSSNHEGAQQPNLSDPMEMFRLSILMTMVRNQLINRPFLNLHNKGRELPGTGQNLPDSPQIAQTLAASKIAATEVEDRQPPRKVPPFDPQLPWLLARRFMEHQDSSAQNNSRPSMNTCQQYFNSKQECSQEVDPFLLPEKLSSPPSLFKPCSENGLESHSVTNVTKQVSIHPSSSVVHVSENVLPSPTIDKTVLSCPTSIFPTNQLTLPHSENWRRRKTNLGCDLYRSFQNTMFNPKNLQFDAFCTRSNSPKPLDLSYKRSRFVNNTEHISFQHQAGKNMMHYPLGEQRNNHNAGSPEVHTHQRIEKAPQHRTDGRINAMKPPNAGQITSNKPPINPTTKRKRGRPAHIPISDNQMHVQLSASTHHKSEPWSPLSFAVDRLTISKSAEVKTKPNANDCTQGNHPRVTSTYFPLVPEQQQSSFRQVEKPNELSRSELHYRLAYFLVRDLQPPEVLDEIGFKTLINSLLLNSTNTAVANSYCGLPSAEEMRHRVLRRLCQKTSQRLEDEVHMELLNGRDEPSHLEPNTGKSYQFFIPISLVIDFWDHPVTTSPCVHSLEDSTPTKGVEVYADTILHLPTARQPFKKVVFSGAQKISSPSDLLPSITHRHTQLCSNFGSEITKCMHHVIVTNRAKLLEEMIHQSSLADQLLVIPCFVSELIAAIEDGLKLTQVSDLIQQCKTVIQKSEASPQIYAHTSVDACTRRLSTDEQINEQFSPKLQEHLFFPSDDKVSAEDRLVAKQPSCAFVELLSLVSWYEETRDGAVESLAELRSANEILSTVRYICGILKLTSCKDIFPGASMIIPLMDNLFQRFDRLLGGTSKTQKQSAVTSKYDVEYEDRNEPPHSQFIRSVRTRLLHTYQAAEPVSKALNLATIFDPRWNRRYSENADLVYQYLLEMHPYIGRCGAPKIHSIYSELDRYMHEPLLAVDQNPLEWWVNKTNTFPQLAEFARSYLLFPMSTLLRPSESSVRHSSSTLSPLPISSFTTNPHAWLDELVQEYEKLDVSEVFAALVQTNRNMPRSLSILADDVSDYCFLWYNWTRTSVSDLDD